MCEATTIAYVAAVVVGAVYTNYSSNKQGRYQSNVADYNARVAENEAEQTRNVATDRENVKRQQTAALLSKQKAQLGAAGLDLTSGSPLQLQEDTIALGEADALRIRDMGGQQYDSLNTGADLTRSGGAFAKSAAKAKGTGSLLNAGTNVLGTGVSDKWFTPDSAAAA